MLEISFYFIGNDWIGLVAADQSASLHVHRLTLLSTTSQSYILHRETRCWSTNPVVRLAHSVPLTFGANVFFVNYPS